jgi:hypothetical protein
VKDRKESRIYNRQMEGMFGPCRLLVETNLRSMGLWERRAMVCFVDYAIEYSRTGMLTACCRWCLYGQFAARNVHQRQLYSGSKHRGMDLQTIDSSGLGFSSG